MSEQMREIYLDYAAATPVSDSVMHEMMPYFTERFYNPSAPYACARSVKTDLDNARKRVASVLGTRPANITFTAGATEANNLALASSEGRILVSAIEHDSIMAPARQRNYSVLAVDKCGHVSVDEVKRRLDDTVELVSIALANGEIGTIQPLRKISKLVQEERMRRLTAGSRIPLFFHTDASQAAGAVSVRPASLGVDLMTLSASKIYGPKQVGLLWHADGVSLHPLIAGGGQELGLRSGTENVAGIMGFARALEEAEKLRGFEVRRLRMLSLRLRKALESEISDILFSGPTNVEHRLPGLVHVSIKGVEARRLVIALESCHVSVGTGSACAASKMKVSETLRAIGLDREWATGSLRISMGRDTTNEDVDTAAALIIQCVADERARLSSRGGRNG